MIYRGKVIRRPFAVGSKSEHEAVMLSTGDGDYVLRRLGGLAFGDPELADLVGQHVECEGTVEGHTLFMSRCAPADRPESG